MTKFQNGDRVKVTVVTWPIEGKVEVGDTGTIESLYAVDTDATPVIHSYVVRGDKGWKYGMKDNELELA